MANHSRGADDWEGVQLPRRRSREARRGRLAAAVILIGAVAFVLLAIKTGESIRPLPDEIDFDLDATGDRMVFTGAGNGRGDLYLLDWATQRAVRLTKSMGRERTPAFAPDGTWIVFAVETQAEANACIYRLDLSRRRVEPLTDGMHRDTWPAVSPDGRQIAFVRGSGATMPVLGITLPTRFTVCVMDADGQHLRELDTKGAFHREPTSLGWRPDGKALVFCGMAVSGGYSDDVHAIDAQSGAVRTLRKEAGAPCVLAGDGRLAFVGWDKVRTKTPLYAVRLAAPDGRAEHPLVPPKGYDGAYAERLRERRSHGTLLLVARDDAAKPRLWELSLDGKRLELVADSELFRRPLKWTGEK